MAPKSANFEFLQRHNAQLTRLGALAERYFRDDPNTCLIKLRQFGEFLAQITAAKVGLFESAEESQAELLRRLKFERVLSPEVADLFHHIRIVGNRATHPLGKSPHTDQGEEGRFRCFTRQQISDRNDNLDIAWLRDTSYE
jgi:type I restriction enzyme, R subunit